MKKAITIVLVEDDDGDAELFMEAINGSSLKNEIVRLVNGEEAVDYIENNSSTGHVIFLDLNLPKIDGREVLKKIKEDADWKTCPVIVMTTSESHEDIIQCYEQSANIFITKPVRFDEFVRIIKTMKNVWLELVVVP